MSLTDKEKEIALECFGWYLRHAPSVSAESMFDEFLSRIREEQEAYAYEVTQRHPKLEVYFAKWFKPHNVSPEDMAEYELSYIPLFTTPPAAQCDCSELVEALKAYDQIVRITISRLIRQYGKDDDEYAIELRECLGNACEALANHAKRMKLPAATLGEE